ncbi:MAG: flagellar hook-basal body complex protein, partial [Lachnospiraceae bacterium]|nr:flagellar hook-basal body complex protein [Lachnospiraceae bacterium]
DIDGNPIVLPEGAGADAVSVGKDGAVAYVNGDGEVIQTGQRIALYQFENPVGLEKISGNLLAESENSGPAINEATTNLNIIESTMAQGYLEGSNVNVADEMVNLIITQRAYELNSKAITTSDSMLETANNLRR